MPTPSIFDDFLKLADLAIESAKTPEEKQQAIRLKQDLLANTEAEERKALAELLARTKR